MTTVGYLTNTTLVLGHQKLATDKTLTLQAQFFYHRQTFSDLGLGSNVCRIHLLAGVYILHNFISKLKHSRCKKEWLNTKKPCEKDLKSNGQQSPPTFDRYNSYGHDNLTENIVISGVQGFLMLMGSLFLIKMTRPHNIKIKQCSLVVPIKSFDFINIIRP